MVSNPFDFLILGAGSTAFAAAIKASELGAKVGMIECRTLGGTCANRGCLPSKNLLEAARIVWQASHPRFAGLHPAAMEIDFAALIRQKDDVVHAYRAQRYEQVAEGLERLELIKGDARLHDANTVSIDGTKVGADRLLIATGTRPTVPPIPGLDSIPFLTSDLLDADEEGRLAELPESLVVLGGGYVAVELAQLFARLGSRVTILQRGERLLARHEPEIADLLATLFRSEGIEVLTRAAVEQVRGDPAEVAVDVEVAGERRTVRSQRLLVAAGRQPNTDLLGLDEAGVSTTETGFVKVNAGLQTNQPHIWAAGDVIDGQWASQLATPVGARQGRLAAENAIGGAHHSVDHAVVPRAIFTDPPIASVGLTEAEVRRRHLPAISKSTPMEYVPRASAIHRPEGMVKIVASSIDERVLGVHVIGEAASEIVHEAAMGMRFNATLADFVDLIHVYPTMAEALKIGALAFSRDVSKLSCCAE